MEVNVNCAEACVDGCIMPDNCPNQEYAESASEFIQNTSLDDMLSMADEAVRRKAFERASQPTQWVIPDEI